MDAFIKITNEISKRIILTKFSTLKILPKYVDNQRRTTFTKSVLTSPKKKKKKKNKDIEKLIEELDFVEWSTQVKHLRLCIFHDD